MLNRNLLQGNLVRDPEFADSRDDVEIINFTVASTRKYKDKEDTVFMDCTAYGKTAENIGKYFHKGDPILVEGRNSQNNWEDRDGNKRSKKYITVEAFHFVGPIGDKRDSGNNRDRGARRGSGGQNQGRGQGRSRGRENRDDRGDNCRDDRSGGGQGGQDFDDNVPF